MMIMIMVMIRGVINDFYNPKYEVDCDMMRSGTEIVKIVGLGKSNN